MNHYAPKKAWLIWLVAASFVQFQFILQLGSGVIIGSIMKELGLSALMAGLLSSSYYYIYVSLQTPSGMLCDRFDVRKSLTLGAIICSFGCYLFSLSTSFELAFIARILTGGGAACAFVAMVTLIKQWFPARQFATIIGLSEAIALIGTIAATVFLSHVIQYIGWRNASKFSCFIGLTIALLCWLFIEEQQEAKAQKKERRYPFQQAIKTVVKDKLAWANGLYIGIGFSTITVYAALWSIPFLESKLHLSLSDATLITSFIYLGAVIGCPLYGVIFDGLGKRKPLLYFSSISTALVFTWMIYASSQSIVTLSVMNLILGLCCSSYMLAFSVSNQLAPQGLTNTYTGFTNAISVATAPCLQPLIGYLLDVQTTDAVNVFSTAQYQHALMILPIASLLSALLIIVLPEESSETEIATLT